MVKRHYGSIIAIATVAMVVVGCESTADYQRLARAGVVYVDVVNGLLDYRNAIGIDQTSLFLLQTDQIAEEGTTFDVYEELREQDIQRANFLGDIRKHNQLLSEYFQTLGQLASSDSPQIAQLAINDIITNMNALNLRLLPQVDEQRLTSRLANLSLTRLVLNSRLRGALRTELEERQDYIRQQLILQQELLGVIAEQIEAAYRDRRDYEERIRVINPLLSRDPIPDPTEWIMTRREILTTDTTPQQVREAQLAAVEFQRIFESFVSGQIDSRRLDHFLTNIESLLASLQSLRD